MSDQLEALLATTFATREDAEKALDKAKGNLPKARKALGARKGAAIDPALGDRALTFAAAARRHARPTRSGGDLQLLGLEVPRDLALLLHLNTHWRTDLVELGGARIYTVSEIAFVDQRISAGAPWACQVGVLANGCLVGCRMTSPPVWVALDPDDGEQTFASFEQVLDFICADAAARGLTTELDAPPPAKAKPKRAAKPKAPAGPPPLSTGEEHRVYAGATELQVMLASVNLYHEPRMVQFELSVKTKLPPDDLWLVSREGALFRLTMLGKPSRGTVTCQASPVDAG